MKHLKLNSPILRLCLAFFTWRVFLIIISLFAIQFISLANTDRFLGGGFLNYIFTPEFFSWANFDGEHYLSIAIFGYKGLEQTFFPVYPLLISLLSKPFSYDLPSSLINSIVSGLLISNICFLLALIALWKLLIIDFSKKFASLVLLLIMIFPTSFYFGALYNESLFLLLTVLTFLFARKRHWFLASCFGMIASATRLFGVLLLPALLIEAYLQKEKLSAVYWIFLIPVGLLGYMYYQYLSVGDPFAFYNLQKLVGEQRQSGLVILPQTYFRYLKMLTSVNPTNFIYQTILLEFLVGIIFFILPIYAFFKKIRPSYVFYALAGFLISSIQGSFSSVPRYVLVFFPSFIALAFFINKLSMPLRVLVLITFALLLVVETAFFLRGYWIA